MPKPSPFIIGSTRKTIYQDLCARDPQVKRTLERLLASVPMPLDAPCLGFVCAAARNSLQAAFSLIPDLNQVAQSLLMDMTSLDKACKEVYGEHEAADALDTLYGRKTKYTGWTTLAFLASNGVPVTSGRLAAAGMELAIKLTSTNRKLLAEAHMRQLGTGHLDYDVTADELVKGIHFESMGLAEVLPWFPRVKKYYFRILSAFSAKPPPPPPPRFFHDHFNIEAKLAIPTCLADLS